MNKQKTRHYKTVVKNTYNQKSNYFVFDVKDKKWQGIYSVIIKSRLEN